MKVRLRFYYREGNAVRLVPVDAEYRGKGAWEWSATDLPAQGRGALVGYLPDGILIAYVRFQRVGPRILARASQEPMIIERRKVARRRLSHPLELQVGATKATARLRDVCVDGFAAELTQDLPTDVGHKLLWRFPNTPFRGEALVRGIHRETTWILHCEIQCFFGCTPLEFHLWTLKGKEVSRQWDDIGVLWLPSGWSFLWGAPPSSGWASSPGTQSNSEP